MALAKAMKGATHRAQAITWQDEDGTAINLTNATITGKLRSASDTVTSILGTLSATQPTTGVFTWTYAAGDVDTAGMYDAQFTATYGDSTKEISFETAFEVKEVIS